MINVSLPADVEQFLHQAVAEGKFSSEQEAVAAAVRLLRDSAARCQRLRRDIGEALAGVDRGEGVEIQNDEELAKFFDELEAETRAAAAADKQGTE
jgi:putative addiction module CopG family antidote